jgi:F420-dependent methylenetetrahydromethanopterin dehydrogenase
MRVHFAIASIILFSLVPALAGESSTNVPAALAEIRSGDQGKAQQAIADLRKMGPAGLDVLLAQYDQHPDPNLIPAIDAVAGQRGAVVSRLYWYTDLAEAEAAARAKNKPILYLRLMGKLTDEYSCANSRYFRTVLYFNRQVSDLLRQSFILVWVSERPVPVVTIDFGDGRTMKRTLTGNSIHYVLNSDGNVIDALPGLFDPVTFARIVGGAGEVAGGSFGVTGRYAQHADDAILRQWKKDVVAVDPKLILADTATVKAAEQADAAAAMRRAVSKANVEAPLLRQLSPQFAPEMDQSIDALNAESWRQIAALHAADAKLDEQSIDLVRGQNPTVYADPAALERTVEQFQELISEDSVRDNYQMRRKVLGWMINSPTPIALEDLNRRVYSELFLTPRNDPWLGLLPEGIYTALTNDGCCTPVP